MWRYYVFYFTVFHRYKVGLILSTFCDQKSFTNLMVTNSRIYTNEVQARAPRGDPPRKQDCLRIFLVEKNLLAHKLWMNMFLIRTYICIVRKEFCLERIIWPVARTISIRDLFKIFCKHFFRQRDILIWTAGSPCNTPHNSFYSAKENCLINQYFQEELLERLLR